MNDGVRRYLIPAYGAIQVQADRAVSLSEHVIAENPSINSALVYVWSRCRMREDTTISRALGAQRTRLLLRRESADFGGAGSLRLATHRTIRSAASADLILVVYATADMLRRVESRPNVKAIVVLTHHVGRVEEWIHDHSPVVHGSVDLVVVEGLRSLMDRVSPSQGLRGDARDAARELFGLLRAAGHDCAPLLVAEWVTRSGWSEAVGAQIRELAKLAPTMSRAARHWRPDLVRVLTERARRDHDLFQ